MFANARLNDHGVLAGFCGFKASLVWGVGCGKVGGGGNDDHLATIARLR